jgi:hypothetical protein
MEEKLKGLRRRASTGGSSSDWRTNARVTDSSLPDFSPAIAAKKLGDASAYTNITLAKKETITAEKNRATSFYFFGTLKPA